MMDNDDEMAVGGVNASESTVLAYLTHPKGGNLPRERAQHLMKKYHEKVAAGIKWASFANYVGDEILRAEGLPQGTYE